MTLSETVEPSGVPPSSSGFLGSVWQFLKQMAKRPVSFISMMIVIMYIGLAFAGPAIAPYDFDEIQRGDDRRALKELPPSSQFLMGTDNRGRDVFSRILWGARETIGLPAAATALAVLFGAILGLATGYIGGTFDEVVSRIMDSLLSIPALVLALVMLTTIVPILNNSTFFLIEPLVNTVGATSVSLVIVVVLLYLPIVMRVVRSSTLSIRDSGYIEAARLRGESIFYILFREILPGVLPALVVEGSLRLSYAIFLVASLGFLGLGVQPPSPEWGRMVLDARNFGDTYPWMLWYPVGAIASLIVSINLMSDGLRKVLRNEDQRG